jgi:hypothetical protein
MDSKQKSFKCNNIFKWYNLKMRLKEFIYSECKKINSELSPDSLAAMVMLKFSKNPHFKDNYEHFELISKGDEIRLISTPLNNATGITNNRTGNIIISSDVYDYHLDSYFDRNVDEKEIIILRDEKYKNINDFFNILEKSNSLKDLMTNLKNGNINILLDIKQNICQNSFDLNIKSINNITELLYYLTEMKTSRGYYKVSNNNVDFGCTFARDVFECSSLDYLANTNNEEQFKKVINNIRYDYTALFENDLTGEVSEEVKSIILDDKRDNWDAVNLIVNDLNYNNKLLETSLLKINSDDKHIAIAELFFDDLKVKALLEKECVLSVYKSSSELDVKHRKTVDYLVSKTENKFINNKNDKPFTVETKEFPPTSEYSDSPIPEYMDSLNPFNFYDNENFNKATLGLGYALSDNFSYTKNKDEILITLKNDNEVIGFGNFYKENNCIRVNIVNIGNNHQGAKLSKHIYKAIIDYASKANIPLLTSMYTKKGSERLPKIKQSLLDENKNVVWLDSCTHQSQTKVEKILSEMSDSLLILINRDFPNIKMSVLRSAIDKEKIKISEIIGTKENYWDFDIYQLKKDFFENIKNELEKSLVKNKKLKL